MTPTTCRSGSAAAPPPRSGGWPDSRTAGAQPGSHPPTSVTSVTDYSLRWTITTVMAGSGRGSWAAADSVRPTRTSPRPRRARRLRRGSDRRVPSPGRRPDHGRRRRVRRPQTVRPRGHRSVLTLEGQLRGRLCLSSESHVLPKARSATPASVSQVLRPARNAMRSAAETVIVTRSPSRSSVARVRSP
jgi:hypothetical protein